MKYIAHMLKGSAKIVSADTVLHIQGGDVFFIPRNLSYQSYWHGEDEIEFLSFGFLDIEARENLNFPLQSIDCDERLKSLIMHIPVEGASVSCEALSHFYNMMAQILTLMKRNQGYSGEDAVIEKAKKYMANHLDCSVSEIARVCLVSEPYLYKAFKVAGCTPNDYKLKVKCQRGIEYLLSTDKTVEEISAIAGFSSASHFRRTLKKQTGLVPNQIRKSRDF